MFLPKTIILFAALTFVNSRTIKNVNTPYIYVEDNSNIIEDDAEDLRLEKNIESVYPISNLRMKRQLHGVMNTNPDGSVNLIGKLPLAENSNNVLSATGSLNGVKPEGSYSSVGGGLALDNVNGHGLSLSGKHIPNFGNQLTGAGKVNLLNTDNHNLATNAFITRTLPNNLNIPNFNTYGAGLDYMFNNKAGVSLGVAHTPHFQKTDLSAMGNLNLFRDKTSSLDFNAGATRSFSPFIPKSSWQPSVGLTFSKYF